MGLLTKEKKPKSFNIDFMGVGTPKCGTEWLVACLRDHPEIEFSRRKEPNFFLSPMKGLNKFVYENIRDKSWQEYMSEYAFEEGKIRGEFSIQYIFDPKALKKVKKAFPDIKIILALRDPVKFLHSIYWYMKYSNVFHLVPDTFEEAIQVGKEGDPYYKGYAKFYKYVKECLEIFGEKNTLIILQDDIKKDSALVVENLFKFIGVDSNFKPKSLFIYVNRTKPVRSATLMRLVNISINFVAQIGLGKQLNDLMNSTNAIRRIYRKVMHVEGEYPKMSQKTEKKLRNELRPDIEKLEKIIGRDLSHWK